jgi:hypothetical protein
MSKKNLGSIHVTIDQAKLAREVSREVFGSVKGDVAHKSKKDYDRKNKRAQRERNRIRKGEYE